MKYEVRDVVCDYGVYENEKLCLICNSRRNALQIVDIMRADTEHEILVLQPVVHGHWIDRGNDIVTCSRCLLTDLYVNEYGEGSFNNYKDENKYCRCCGAKMDGENE